MRRKNLENSRKLHRYPNLNFEVVVTSFQCLLCISLSVVMHSVFSVALLAAVTNCVTAATPTSAPTGIDYESMFQSAFVVPTSAPYNSIIGSNTGLSSSEYVDESRRRLESDNAGLRGDRALLNSVKNFLGASPSPAYRGWSGTLHRNVPHPAAGGGGGGGGGGPPPPNCKHSILC